MKKEWRKYNYQQEEWKNQHTETNNTITEIKNTLEEINSKILEVEQISEFEGEMMDTTIWEQNKVKTMKKKEDSLRNFCKKY